LLTADDGEELYASVLRARIHLSRWTTWSGRINSGDMMGGYITGWSARPQYGIEVEGRLGGMLGIYGANEEPWLDLGYWIEPAFTGRGIMTRAVRTLATWADRPILLAIHPNNAASLAVARRLELTKSDEDRIWHGEALRVFRGVPDPYADMRAPSPDLAWHSRGTWLLSEHGEPVAALAIRRLKKGVAEIACTSATERALIDELAVALTDLFRAGQCEGIFHSIALVQPGPLGEAVAEIVGLRKGKLPDGKVAWQGVPGTILTR